MISAHVLASAWHVHHQQSHAERLTEVYRPRHDFGCSASTHNCLHCNAFVFNRGCSDCSVCVCRFCFTRHHTNCRPRLDRVNTLVNMGFERSEALHQLVAHGDNQFSAVDALLEGDNVEERDVSKNQERLDADDGSVVDRANFASMVSTHVSAGSSLLCTSSFEPDGVPETEACVVCWDEEANACLIPCGHTNVCMKCVKNVNPKKCPVCRFEFEDAVMVATGSLMLCDMSFDDIHLIYGTNDGQLVCRPHLFRD